MNAFLWILISALALFGSGFGVGFFVMRNNPRFFKIDTILKDEKSQIINKARKLGEEKRAALKKYLTSLIQSI